MSVEVIKHGKKNITKCKFCGATLKYSKDDIKARQKYLSQIYTYPERYIKCPDCNGDVVLE